ncbi:hypothetical protein L3Q82_010511 [Scortum barcoo]|uniref:Uncharacterized protein n=1 Tax=Scortum barcoo TaxID=214431 RepID=A0ACB8WC26_9TELE|nr:hypothetical protein L3Q82_010511 [Scortum barcoo]
MGSLSLFLSFVALPFLFGSDLSFCMLGMSDEVWVIWVVGSVVGLPVERLESAAQAVQARREKKSGSRGEQHMADLPMDRVTPDHPPFINVGVDFFGPFEVKCGRKTVKRYGVIFACLNIRAVHLEVAYSLDTHSCINAIRRFIARRGQVKLMRSDNGTNLVRAERELRDALKELDDVHIKDTLLKRGITWAFNPPQVPTMVAYGRDKSRPDDGETHNCLAELQVLCSLRPDRSDTPLTNPDLILYVDGSGNRDPLTGLDCVGFAMTQFRIQSSKVTVAAAWLEVLSFGVRHTVVGVVGAAVTLPVTVAAVGVASCPSLLSLSGVVARHCCP